MSWSEEAEKGGLGGIQREAHLSGSGMIGVGRHWSVPFPRLLLSSLWDPQ